MMTVMVIVTIIAHVLGFVGELLLSARCEEKEGAS